VNSYSEPVTPAMSSDKGAEGHAALLLDVLKLARRPDLSDRQFRILALYRTYESKAGWSFPADETVAAILGISVRQLRNSRSPLIVGRDSDESPASDRGHRAPRLLVQRLRGPRTAEYRVLANRPNDDPTDGLGNEEGQDPGDSSEAVLPKKGPTRSEAGLPNKAANDRKRGFRPSTRVEEWSERCSEESPERCSEAVLPPEKGKKGHPGKGDSIPPSSPETSGLTSRLPQIPTETGPAGCAGASPAQRCAAGGRGGSEPERAPSADARTAAPDPYPRARDANGASRGESAPTSDPHPAPPSRPLAGSARPARAAPGFSDPRPVPTGLEANPGTPGRPRGAP